VYFAIATEYGNWEREESEQELLKRGLECRRGLLLPSRKAEQCRRNEPKEHRR